MLNIQNLISYKANNITASFQIWNLDFVSFVVNLGIMIKYMTFLSKSLICHVWTLTAFSTILQRIYFHLDSFCHDFNYKTLQGFVSIKSWKQRLKFITAAVKILNINIIKIIEIKQNDKFLILLFVLKANYL